MRGEREGQGDKETRGQGERGTRGNGDKARDEGRGVRGEEFTTGPINFPTEVEKCAGSLLIPLNIRKTHPKHPDNVKTLSQDQKVPA